MVLILIIFFFFFFNYTATTEIYTLSLHDALPLRPAAEAGLLPPAGAGRADAGVAGPAPVGRRRLVVRVQVGRRPRAGPRRGRPAAAAFPQGQRHHGHVPGTAAAGRGAGLDAGVAGRRDRRPAGRPSELSRATATNARPQRPPGEKPVALGPGDVPDLRRAAPGR